MIASKAFEHFADKNYEAARSVLDGLKNDNIKVKHNALLARYFQQSLTADELLNELLQLLKPAHDTKAKNQEEDTHVIMYNTALLMVQLQQYYSAVSLLEERYVCMSERPINPLYAHKSERAKARMEERFARIEPIDDFLAIKISFLLVEAYLRLREPYRAMEVISYLEKPNSFIASLARRQGKKEIEVTSTLIDDLDIDDEAAKQYADHLPVFSDVPKPQGWIPAVNAAAFLKDHGKAPDTLSLHEYTFYLTIYKARTRLQILAADACEDINGQNEIVTDIAKAYKLIGEIRNSQVLDLPTLQSLKDDVARQQVAMCRCLMAQVEFLTGSFTRCLAMLSTCRFHFLGTDSIDTESGTVDDGLESKGPHPANNERTGGLFYNNLGLLNLKMKKPALAAVYFQKALQLQHVSGPQVLPSEKAWCQDQSLEVRYNLGVTMLMLNHPFQAFRELKPLVSSVRWPRLWLRIADCCMGMRKELERRGCSSEKSSHGRIIKTIQGRGKARRFILLNDSNASLPARASTGSTNEGYHSARTDMRTDGSALSPQTSAECLQCAAVALKNALIECRDHCLDQEPRDPLKQCLSLRLSTVEDAVLVKLSYVLLCQKDYAQALYYAREVLRKHDMLASDASGTAAPAADGDDGGSPWAVIPPKQSGRTPSVTDVKSVGVLRLAVTYAAECLTALNKVYDAKCLLTGFLTGQFLPRGASKTNIVEAKYTVDCARKVKPPQASRRPPCTIEQLVTAGYDVSPWSILPMQPSNSTGDVKLFFQEETTTLIEAQAELYANMACLHAALCEQEKTEDFNVVASFIDVASAMSPKSVAALRTRLYLKMRAKKHADAMQLLKAC